MSASKSSPNASASTPPTLHQFFSASEARVDRWRMLGRAAKALASGTGDGFLEICVRLLCRHVQITGMYRPHDSAALEWAVKRGRLRYTQAMFTRDELRPAIRLLKSGGVLWFAPDQETRRGESVFVPFFGQSAWSLTSTHQLARLSGALVLPLFHERLDNGHYHLEIGAPLENFPSTDADTDTARVMALMEALIRRVPAQYLWIHQRFKRQPEGRASPYQ